MSNIMHAVVLRTDIDSGEVINELFPIIDLSPTSYFGKDTQMATLSVYFDTKEEASEIEDKINQALIQWKEFSEFGECEVAIHEVVKEDWANAWKAFWHVDHVTDRIVIKPSWEEYETKDGEIIIELDPGMSFGTGSHGTTRGCIEFIDELEKTMPKASLIDMGCGSGILSIAAIKLGFTEVEAFDYDQESIDVSTDNYQKTQTLDEVKLYIQDLNEYVAEKTFDIVVANILPHVLVPNKERILSALSDRDGATVILSGILNEQYEELKKEFESIDLKEAQHKVIGKWTSGSFTRA